jgi:hypothetical protein
MHRHHLAPTWGRALLAILISTGILLGAFPSLAAAAAATDNVHERGGATFYGSTGTTSLQSPVVAMDRTPSGNGYWLVTEHGAVYGYGDAAAFGGPFISPSFESVVDLATRPAGGYWTLTNRGSVMNFGGAPHYGGSPPFNAADPIVAMAAHPASTGYLLLSRSGGVFTYGSAQFLGSIVPNATAPAVDIAYAPDGMGYWITEANGNVTRFGSALDHGDLAPGTATNVVAFAALPNGSGYRLVTSSGAVHVFGAATNDGGLVSSQRVVDLTSAATGGYWITTIGNAVEPGIVRGTITGQGGAALPGICVLAYQGFNSFARTSAKTDANGMYELRGLRTGAYHLFFDDCTNGAYIGEWWNDKNRRELADPINTVDGTVLENTNATLTLGSALSGTVTGPNGPIERACVSAYKQGAISGEPGTSVTGNYVIARTSVTGAYRIGGLPVGSYRVKFDDCGTLGYFPEWWQNQAYEATSTPIALRAEGSQSGIDGSLERSGLIDGVVKNQANDVPIPSICVSAENSEGRTFDTGRTTITGYYRISSLPADSYRVRFHEDCTGQRTWAAEWNNDKPSRQLADPVPVSTVATTTVNAALSIGGAISGVVTTPTIPTGVHAVCVTAFDGSREVSRTTTSVTGFYTVRGLHTGTYSLRFNDCAHNGRNVGLEWYDDAATAGAATPVAVQALQTRTGVNAVLGEGGEIAGIVRDGSGQPLANVCVTAHDRFGAVASVRNTVTGFYVLGGLHTDSYQVSFNDCNPSSNQRTLAQSWNGGTATKESSTPVSVTRGARVDGVDGALTAAGAITGVLTGAGGFGPLSGACANAYVGAEQAGVTGVTSVTGLYRIGGLRAGTYTVRFEDCADEGWRPEWYADATLQPNATPVGTTAGSPTGGVDAQLSVGVPRPPRSTFAPVASADRLRARRNGTATVNVLQNDSDPSGLPLRIVAWENGAKGSVSCTSAGVCSYRPRPGASGPDAFGYVVSNGPHATRGVVTVQFAATGADFDGDGDTDVAIYRPSTQAWFVQGGLATGWGTPEDVAVPADYNGDGATDVAVFRPSDQTWYVSGGGTWAGISTQWGMPGDLPVPGDYDGDGDDDIAVYRPSDQTWYSQGGLATQWGVTGDQAVPADYDGDGDTDVAVFRPSDQTWYVQGGLATQWGVDGDLPAVGDYDADGDDDVAVFRPSDQTWYVQGGLATQWGVDGDVPVIGDYDADGDDDIAVYRPSDATWYVRNGISTQWGASGDVPVVVAAVLRDDLGI